MSDRLISEYRSDNGKKSAIVMSDAYGTYFVEYYENGYMTSDKSYPGYTLNAVEDIAEDFVQNKGWDVV